MSARVPVLRIPQVGVCVIDGEHTELQTHPDAGPRRPEFILLAKDCSFWKLVDAEHKIVVTEFDAGLSVDSERITRDEGIPPPVGRDVEADLGAAGSPCPFARGIRPRKAVAVWSLPAIGYRAIRCRCSATPFFLPRVKFTFQALKVLEMSRPRRPKRQRPVSRRAARSSPKPQELAKLPMIRCTILISPPRASFPPRKEVCCPIPASMA